MIKEKKKTFPIPEEWRSESGMGTLKICDCAVFLRNTLKYEYFLQKKKLIFADQRNFG